MEAYTSFARVYDTFMDNIPYEEWCEYLTGLMREYGVRDGLVLDLGDVYKRQSSGCAGGIKRNADRK